MYRRILLYLVLVVAGYALYKQYYRAPPQSVRLRLPPQPYVGFFPANFVESQFPTAAEAKQQADKDRYIGTFMNAGVIYDEAFLRAQQQQTLKEPGTFTPYPQDYIYVDKRPAPKTFPAY